MGGVGGHEDRRRLARWGSGKGAGGHESPEETRLGSVEPLLLLLPVMRASLLLLVVVVSLLIQDRLIFL